MSSSRRRLRRYRNSGLYTILAPVAMPTHAVVAHGVLAMVGAPWHTAESPGLPRDSGCIVAHVLPYLMSRGRPHSGGCIVARYCISRSSSPSPTPARNYQCLIPLDYTSTYDLGPSAKGGRGNPRVPQTLALAPPMRMGPLGSIWEA
jgi:hypothetical protein